MTMKSTLRSRARNAAVFAFAAAALALVGPGASGASGKYTDPSGDARGGPDITNVEVFSAPNGQILFRVSVTGIQPGSDTLSFLEIDADANPLTGNLNALGAEYSLVLDELEHAYGFARWNGSAWDWDAPSSTVQVTAAPGMFLVSVNASELGGTQSFNFWVRSILGELAAGTYDDAPDDDAFNYTLAVGGPEIREVALKATPSAPRAGRRFSVSATSVTLPVGTAGSPAKPESFACTARLGTRALRGTGAGGCTYAIPKRAKGKRLTVTVTVNYQGSSKSVVQVYRVR
jgi:hypothetical protein